MPQESFNGMGPRAGIVGVFPIKLQFLTIRKISLPCDIDVVGDLPAIASKFARLMKDTYASSWPGMGSRRSKFNIQHFSHWKGMDACTPVTPWLSVNS